jgi:hypothetical protein
MAKTTEAQKRATVAYRNRLKGTPKGDILADKMREYARKSFMKIYNSDEEFREKKKEECRLRVYYDNSDDKFLRAVRRLYEL